MAKKIIILTILLIFLIASPVLAETEPSLEEIQSLISQGKRGLALKILNKHELKTNTDLKFFKGLLLSWKGEYKKAEIILLDLIKSNPERLDSYNQLARIYGWQGYFQKARTIIKKAQKIKYSSTRTAILAQHAEWQQNYFKAKRLIEEAIFKAESEELRNQYQQRLAKLKNEIKAVFFLEGRAVYSENNKEDLELSLGLEKLLIDGLNLKTSAGINYFKSESNFIFKSKLEINRPLIFEKTFFDSELVYYNGQTKDRYEINNSFYYLIDSQNLFGINFNFIENSSKADYQSLELEYEHKFEKIIMVLKNTSRNYNSNWTTNFSQHLDLYYPRANYLLNLAVSYYESGDYVVKF